MAKSIGIDLGTTNSVAAIKKVEVEILKNDEGDLLTPSCVCLKKRTVSRPSFVVGKHALDWMKQDPSNTVTAVKRLMGRSIGEREVQRVLSSARLHYRVDTHSRGTENSLAVILGGREFTPEEISAEILKKVKKDAEKSLGDEVAYAVITVPAYFNDKQKHATRTAAALAGLKVRRLLPEPTAAAISFGIDNVKGEDAKTVLIFDFGGGTFDLSVLTISGGQFIEQGKGGDMWLGGEDIDRAIVEYVLRETARENEIDDITALVDAQTPEHRNRFLAELKVAVERAKIRLSDEMEAHVEVLGVLRDADGDPLDVDVELTRAHFNELIEPMVTRILELTKESLGAAHFTEDLIDQVLLVGGSSCIPRVIEAMQEAFGAKKVLVHERPMLAVAEGAAILSHRLADVYECPECGKEVRQSDLSCSGCGFDLEAYTIDRGVLDIVHSSAHDYYVRLENDERWSLVMRNTPLPCSTTETFSLVHPDQHLVHLKFYNLVNDVEESIGDLWLGIDRDAIANDGNLKKEELLRVALTVDIDENNLVKVTTALTDHPEIALSRMLSRGQTDEQLYLSLEETINQANEEKYNQLIMMDLMYQVLSVIKDINCVVDPETKKVDEQAFERALMKIDKARRMAADDITTKPVIFYADDLLDSFGRLIPADTQSAIAQKVCHLKEMSENGTYEQHRTAVEVLLKLLRSKELDFVSALMDIKEAGEYCQETDPTAASKYFRSVEDLVEAYYKQDIDKVRSVLDSIMPEALSIVDGQHNRRGEIYKDIRR